jgi:phage-related protein
MTKREETDEKFKSLSTLLEELGNTQDEFKVTIEDLQAAVLTVHKRTKDLDKETCCLFLAILGILGILAFYFVLIGKIINDGLKGWTTRSTISQTNLQRFSSCCE